MNANRKKSIAAGIAALAIFGGAGIVAANAVMDGRGADPAPQIHQKQDEVRYEDPATMEDDVNNLPDDLGVVTDSDGNTYEDPDTMISPEELKQQQDAPAYEDPATMQ